MIGLGRMGANMVPPLEPDDVVIDLPASALTKSRDLGSFSGRVSDSGEGRWTIQAAIDEGVPAPVLSTALYERFGSRGHGEFAAKVLSALRFEFGGHQEKVAGGGGAGGPGG